MSSLTRLKQTLQEDCCWIKAIQTSTERVAAIRMRLAGRLMRSRQRSLPMWLEK